MAVIAGIAVAPCSTPAVAAPDSDEQPPGRGSILLFEPSTGHIIRHHNADRLVYPASLTKLMTTYVAFEAVEEGEIAFDQNIVISNYARRQPATRVGLRRGIDVTLETALRALIIRSANDFAVAIAETIAGSEAEFINRMNITARRLGMTRTNFANPHGLPNPDQFTTARDMALLTAALIRDYPDYADYFSDQEVKIRSLTLRSHNSLLRTVNGADGMKTGFTCASGYNIVASATRNGLRLVAVVIGGLTGSRRNQRAAALLEDGFTNFDDSVDDIDTMALTSSPPTPVVFKPKPTPISKRQPSDILDLSRKTRTWKCGNAPVPRKIRKKRKKRKSKKVSRRSKKK